MLQPALRRRLGRAAAAATTTTTTSIINVGRALSSSALAGPRTAGAGAGAGIRARPWEALQRRGLAIETTEPTPVPPPPPAPRNYVYPAVLALTAATVAFVMMTPDDENIDAKIMEAVKARMPAGGEDGADQEAGATGAKK